MSQNFDFKNIEPKWQKVWFDNNIYQAIDNDKTREKKYILTEFPFPSGANLHVGHVFRYTVPDVYSRFLRAKGYNVMFPIGYDAFGLPTEEKARKDGKNPVVTTQENIASIRKNLQSMGYSFDWSRELATTDPEFYKWTQWIFGEMFKAGLVEQKEVELWYCPNLATVLSNEEVIDDPKGSGLKVSERGEHPVEKKKMNQWMIKITAYAEQLLQGLEGVNWPEYIKDMQRNWIGKSQGCTVDWEVVKPEKTFGAKDESDFKLPIRERSVILVRNKENGKYLTFKFKNDKQNLYRLPGGGVEVGEDVEQAGLRELEEEIGLTQNQVSRVGRVGVVEKFVHYNLQQLEHEKNSDFYNLVKNNGGEYVSRGIEYYYLYEVNKNYKLKPSEADNIAEILEIGAEELKKSNNWEQLNYILEKIENPKILLATHNKSKIERYKSQIKLNNISFITLDDLNLEIQEPAEVGSDEWENAKIKALAYFQKTQIPSLSQDTGFYIQGLEDKDQPKKDVQRKAGVLLTDSQEIRFQKMLDYYTKVAKENGGEIKAYFKDVYCLYDGQNYHKAEAIRPLTLTEKVHTKKDLYFPLCSFYKADSCGKYYHDLSGKEMSEFLNPSNQAVENLIKKYFAGELEPSEKIFKLQTFTTRIDTLPAVSFLAVAPENPSAHNLITSNFQEKCQEYTNFVVSKSERERQIGKEKTGVLTGSFAKNVLTGELVPIYLADYVLAGYGSGCVMGVAGHDERDFEFAKAMGVAIKYNIKPLSGEIDHEKAYTGEGILFNSGKFDGLKTPEQGKKVITNYLVEKNLVIEETNYKFRDWVFSRQRYWGEPFPFEYTKVDSDLHKTSDPVYTTVDGQKYLVNLLPLEKLPLELPPVKDYEPSNDGKSPLAKTDWINIRDSKNQIIGKHESDTMPNWAGSSWYYLRYIDPKNSQTFADQEKLKYWLPVDKYFGGSEHTTLHLLYSRFWHQFLYNQNLVPTMEPYYERINGGILLAEDGSKMSKSKGNVINPDDKIEKYGTDALRLYINFIGPYDATVAWQEGGLKACYKLVENIYKIGQNLSQKSVENKSLTSALHKLIKNVETNINNLKTNVAVAELMTFTNLLKSQEFVGKNIFLEFLKVLAPFAPHLAEELWFSLNSFSPNDYKKSITLQSWPKFNPDLVIEDEVVVVVQVNGKVRAEMKVARDLDEKVLLEMAKKEVEKWLENKTIVFSKIIPNKMVTLAVK